MYRLLLASALLCAALGCETAGPITGCPPAALCVRQPPLVATGRLQASINPIPDAVITLTAYQGTCGGTPVQILPSPAEDTTDAQGRYSIGVFPQQAVPDACIRVAYSSALYVDAPGVALDPTAPPDTLRLDLVGP